VVEVVFAALPGSQQAFLSCPVFEVLYEGTRGPGKTAALLMDFAQHCGKGFGAAWRGILFRKTYKQLSDVVAKSKQLMPRIFPGAKFNVQDMCWTFPDGEQLLLRYMRDRDDYDEYHGHEYPWIAFEELTTWATDECYKLMMSCCRSTMRNMPRKFRATTNPYGVGHNWVKLRFRLPTMRFKPFTVPGEETRVAIYGQLKENLPLLAADPDYGKKVLMAARNPAQAKAWLEGSWDVISGGMFDDLWVPGVHIVPSFPLSLALAHGWRLDRAMDWGSSKPFSVAWYGTSNGHAIEVDGQHVGPVRGDLVRIKEWYGWGGKANEGVRMLAEEVAIGMVDREDDWGVKNKVKIGVADSAIFASDQIERSVSADMGRRGVLWLKADKGPGSRAQGWEQCRKLMKAAIPDPLDGSREDPGFFVCQDNEHFIRTVPVLPRDEDDPDDVDTDAEDHAGDEFRYRARFARPQGQQRSA